MNRLYRLMSPAVTFPAIGTLLIFLAPRPNFRLHGGLITAGVYAVLVQLVLTALLLVGIDDLRGQRRGSNGGLLKAADPSYSLRGALAHFYLRRFTPAFLLAFGLGESAATIAIGIFDRPGVFSAHVGLLNAEVQPYELLVALLLLSIAIFMFRKGVLAYCGWCLGFGCGALLAQVALGPQVVVLSAALIVWLTALLCTLRFATAPLVAAGRSAPPLRS
jgi:hypothetical protein